MNDEISLHILLTILLVLFFSTVFLILYCIIKCCMIPGKNPPSPNSYPSDRRKYRIKEIVCNDGTSVYYIQYRWFIIWRTYKIGKPGEWNKYDIEYVKLEYKDINNAYAKITQLISERNNIDSKMYSKKKNNIKYHYFFNDSK